MFIDFRVPPTTPWSMCLPQAFFPRTKYTLDFMSIHFIHVVIFTRFQGPLVTKIQIWPICSNDYASKTLIEILCKKTWCTAPICFLSLICRVIPANIEPSPECQPGSQINKYPRSIGLIQYHVNKYPRSS